jgi:hypothetical protein
LNFESSLTMNMKDNPLMSKKVSLLLTMVGLIMMNEAGDAQSGPQPVPTLCAVAGDGCVKLYWDRTSEDAIDSLRRYKDLQGYKIYRWTNKDDFISSGINGIKKDYQPTFQVDKKDSVQGYFRAPADMFNSIEGYTYYLGSNSGLVHDTTDHDVVNGRTYYYVIIAYDAGDENLRVIPSENTWTITLNQADAIIGASSNVAIVSPAKNPPGYTEPIGWGGIPPLNTFASGTIAYKVMDASKLTGGTYEVSFTDTRETGAMVPVTTTYSVKDMTLYTDIFTPNKVDTLNTTLRHRALVPGSVTITTLDGAEISSSDYLLDYERGTVRAIRPFALQNDTVKLRKLKIAFKYYPIYRSPHINGSPFVSETIDTDIFDGLSLVFRNEWSVNPIDSLTGFNNRSKSYTVNASTFDIDTDGNGTVDLLAARRPADYDVIFYDTIVDTSSNLYGAGRIPTNFKIWNRTNQRYVTYVFGDGDGNRKVSSLDELIFFENDESGRQRLTWDVSFATPLFHRDTVYSFGMGDTVKLRTTKPFRAGDLYRFTVNKPILSVGKSDVVPPMMFHLEQNYPNPFNPATTISYVVPNTRKVKLTVYNVLGEEVKTLVNRIQNAGAYTVTFDGSRCASGVYFYRVESGSFTAAKNMILLK